MKIISKFLIFLIIFLFVRCSSNAQNINKISYNSVGGEQGGYVNVELT